MRVDGTRVVRATDNIHICQSATGYYWDRDWVQAARHSPIYILHRVATWRLSRDLSEQAEGTEFQHELHLPNAKWK